MYRTPIIGYVNLKVFPIMRHIIEACQVYGDMIYSLLVMQDLSREEDISHHISYLSLVIKTFWFCFVILQLKGEWVFASR